MLYRITLVGVQANEQTPDIAVYTLDARGRIATKAAVAAAGQLDIDVPRLPDVVVFGPDVEDLATLDPTSLLTVRLSDQLPIWEKNKAILIPAQWWRRWLGFQTCLSGQAFRCFLVFGLPEFRNIALGEGPIPLEFCQTLCNAVVEVWRSTCCCWPILLPDVLCIIDGLKRFLAANPIMFPAPPRPNPGPVDRALLRNVNRALGAGKVSRQFMPSTDLSLHLQTLETLSAQDAIPYIEANPVLWSFCCDCSSEQLGETPLNPDGTFNYCFQYFPLFRFDCRTRFFYKLKQFINGQWIYIYDGAAAQQYFSADQMANLYTLSGQTCYQPPALSTNDYIAFQAIGGTNTWELNSNWMSPTSGGVDQNQTGDTSMVTLIPDAGLVVGSGAPWATTLALLLNYDSALQNANPSPYYYRMSIVQAASTGSALSGATTVTLMTPLSWSYFDNTTNPITIASQSLGPVTMNGNQGLYQIPYFGGNNPSWLGNQYHQSLDTTQLANILSGGPGNGNGQFLLILEVFDQKGNRLVPQAAPTPTPTSTDIQGTFNYLRLLSASGTGSLATVPFNSLTHVLWVDNRPVVGDIDDFLVVSGTQTTIGSQECQFLSAPGNALFEVGYRAYHAVMCDDSTPASPIPTATFMANFELSWQEGLNGQSGVLVSGADTNQPNPAWPACPWTGNDMVTPGTMSINNPSPTNTCCAPITPPCPPITSCPSSFACLLGGQPACAFALTLNVFAKHTDGSSRISAYDAVVTAAVALSAT